MKKLISTGLVIFIFLTLSLSVFAADLPDNDVIGGVNLKSMAFRYYDAFTEDYTSTIISLNRYFPFGEVTMIGVQYAADALDSSYPDKIYVSLEFDIILNDNATIYFPVDASRDRESYNFGYLNSYRASDFDVTVNLAPKSLRYGARLDTSSGTSTVLKFEDGVVSDEPLVDVEEVKFLCFREVPKGTYTVSIQTPDNESGVFYNQAFFYVAPFVSIPTLFDDVSNGVYSAPEAYAEIVENLDSIINSNASIEEKQLALSVAELDLQRVYDAETQFMSSLVLPTLVELAGQLSDVLISSTSIEELDNFYVHGYELLVSSYVDALPAIINSNNAILFSEEFETILSFVESVYTVAKSQLEDSVITDEDLAANDEKLEHLVDIYEQEKLAQDAYNDLDLEQLIDLNQWELDVNEFVSYRQIFDQFFKGYSDNGSSVVAMCVSFPFTLLIVSLILGTSGVVFSFTRKD